MKKRIGMILSGTLLAAILLTGVWFIFNKAAPKDGIEFEDNVSMGIMPGVDMEQRLKELQEKLDKGMIAFSVNTNPVFSTGTAAGNLMLENPGNNAKLLIAKIVLNDTQETVFTSKYIKPGSYMDQVKLDKVLEAGVYPATVYFEAYTEDTAEYIGQAGASVTLTVQS